MLYVLLSCVYMFVDGVLAALLSRAVLYEDEEGKFGVQIIVVCHVHP